MSPLLRRISSASACLVLSLLSGCSLSHFSATSTATSILPQISGGVHGGQQPVANAVIQLYATNTTTNKGASTALLSSVVLTDANGNFSITSGYTCPTPGSLVYLTATGGNPGLAAGTNNAALAMMAALGTCGNLLNNSSTLRILLNELTTVAAVEALGPFMADLSHIGADASTNPTALAGAFASAAAIVDFTTGQFAPQTAGGPVPSYALYNTLANILASCINSAGNTGSTSNCYKFLNATNVANDTLAGLLYLQQHPGANPATIFALAGGTGAPFQPSLATQPVDFTAPLTVTVPNTGGSYLYNAYYLTIDGAQHIWVGNFNFFGTGVIHVYDNNENLLNTITTSSFPLAMSTDPFGHVWILTGTSLIEYATDGSLISPAAGYTTKVGNVSPDGYQMAFDTAGNIWTASNESGTSKPCIQKFSSAGASLFTPVCFATSISTPRGIAVDAAGNAYMTALAPSVLFKVDSLGNVITTAPFTATGLPITSGSGLLHYDPVTNHIVVYEPNAFSARNPGGTLAVASVSNTYALQSPTFFTLDGAGDIWLGNTAADPYFSVSEIGPTGTFLTPTTNFPTSGLIPTGINNPKGIGVDSYGNVWVVSYPIGDNTVRGFLQKIPGVAIPKTQQYY